MLECRGLGLAYRYGEEVIKVLDSIDLVVDEAGSSVVYGDRLSGKYYLVRVITGLVRPTSGVVLVDGKAIDYGNKRELNMIRRAVQTYFMDVSRSIPGGMTVSMYIDWLSREFRVRDYTWLINDLWSRFDISPNILDKRIHSLPLHILYMIYVSSGLLAKPRYMILENPTGLINYAYRPLITRFIRSLIEDYGVGVLATTSDPRFFREFGEKKYVLFRGRIIEEGGSEVVNQPLHPYIKKEFSGEQVVTDVVDHIYVSEGITRIYDWGRCPYIDECSYSGDRCLSDIPLYEFGGRRVRCILYSGRE